LWLLKVPKWLSEAWANAPKQAPVVDLDLATGTMRLLPTGGYSADRPQILSMTARASPELFAFSAGNSDSSAAVIGGFCESLQVRASLDDVAYKSMLQRRAQDNSITAGSRSVQLESLRASEMRPEVEQQDSGNFEADPGNVFASSVEPSILEVAVAVDSCLRANSGGVTCQDLLRHLPRGSTFVAIRDALVSMAECRDVGGERRYYPSPKLREAMAPGRGRADVCGGGNGHSVPVSAPASAQVVSRLKRPRPV